MNLLKVGDSLISFLIRHLLRVDAEDIAILVYLQACISVNWRIWKLICKNATRLRLIR
jgi:hypothetical protein